MRILHTSDWHLGRIFHGIHLTEDQAYILEQFIEVIKDTKPDVILISGDVFDRSVPPTEAVNLLDEVISRILMDHDIPIMMIAGNHDSPDRLGFGYRLMQNRGLYIFGKLTPALKPITLEDKYGSVSFYGVPYVEPAIVRERFGDETIHAHDTAMMKLTNYIKSNMNQGSRNVLIAHAFVAGGEESESERPLSVGGSGVVNAAYFKEFDYVALGHLHRGQKISAEHIRYSGSLMKYSFAEADHKKGVVLIDMDAQGSTSIEYIRLRPRRELRCIEGYLEDILKGPQLEGHKEDYLCVTLKDEGAILDAIGKLRKVYPNVLHIERPQLTSNLKIVGPDRDFKKMDTIDLFSSFFQQVTTRDLSNEQKKILQGIFDQYYKNMREE
ncbi:exonuclease SbcCD subunit D [Clostridiaceae bacterium 35-E11]